MGLVRRDLQVAAASLRPDRVALVLPEVAASVTQAASLQPAAGELLVVGLVRRDLQAVAVS